MSEKKKVLIVNLITGSRLLGTLLLPIITSIFGALGTAIYIGSIWATDAIDGYLAKHKWGVSTIFGASLDAFSDKIFGISSLIYLSSFYPAMIIPILFEMGIFATNMHYGKKGSDVKSSKLGKRKTVLLGIITAVTILSTLNLTSGLVDIIPALIGIISAAEAATLIDYIEKNKNYLKNHQPKNNVSKMGIFETIKTIVKKLGDKNIYSPQYYQEHKDEPLLDALQNNNLEEKNENKTNIKEEKQENLKDNNYLTIAEQNELKIEYNLTNKEIETLENYMKFHKISIEEIKTCLNEYIKVTKTNYSNSHEIEEFKNKKEKTKEKKK